MQRHVRKNHSGKRHKCYDCSKSFDRRENMKSHHAAVHAKRRYKCPCYDKTFTSSGCAKNHADLQHHGKRVKCPLAEELSCDKTFCNLRSAKSHANTQHRGIRNKFECRDCGESYLIESGLRYHMDVRHCGKAYRCRHVHCCSKRFGTAREESKHAYNDNHRIISLWQCKFTGSNSR